MLQTLLKLTILSALLVAAAASAQLESRLQSSGPASVVQFNGAAITESKVYIVQLRSPSASEAHVIATTNVVGKPTAGSMLAPPAFSKNSALVQSQVQRIESEQLNVISRVDPNINPIYSYRYAMNGFAARMSPGQANKLKNMPEVVRVWEDEVRPLTTNFSAGFLGLFDSTIGLRGPLGLDGEGIVIGVIDSGVAPQHPALQDFRAADRPRLCESVWAEVALLGRWLCRRYDKMEDVQLFDPPENWNGVCETGPQFLDTDCNNKLIGARFFVDGAQATGPIDSGEIFSPRDVDGHGTHTATTAAGNRVRASIFGTLLDRVEGIAPMARIAVYKACWLRPGATRASCNSSDLANAVDMAVADGVDIINYSVGSSLFTVTAPDDVALMAAAKAGILTVVAAGNEGPGLDTITSPAGNPAVITAGASSRDGQHSLEAIEVSVPAAIAGRYAVKEASFTPRLIDQGQIQGQLVLADDDDTLTDDGSVGTSFDGCQAFINGSEISGNIAFMQRTGCNFDVKVANAQNAGATAAIVFNVSGDPVVMIGDPDGINIPALMVGAADGNLFLDEINNDQRIDVILDKSFLLTEADTGNNMGSFSSRGPGPVADILKPDVTAPGINILAGSTPDAANNVTGEFFAFLTGTSMSTPHVAGVAALLKQAHPDWSPAAIKSALMTTAYQEVTLSDGTTPAIPFDFGSGHIDPNRANDPGLVYEITADEYDAFSCGVGSTDVSQARCDDLEAGGFSFEPADLNQPSISVSRLSNTRTVTRRVTNISDISETFTAQIEMPPGVDVQVSPASLTVGAGQSATYDVTLTFVSGPLDFYRFGSLTWVGSEHSVRSVISVQPLAVDAPFQITSFGSPGTETFPVNFGYTGSYSVDIHGLNPPDRVVDAFINEDPNKTFTLRGEDGVTLWLYDVGPNEAFLRFATFDLLTDGNDDLDMFVYYCPPAIMCLDSNGDALIDNYSKIGQSGGATSEERVDILRPDEGTYAVFIHAFETDNVAGGQGANYTLLSWVLGLVDDPGNMFVTAPTSVTAGSTQNVTVNWNALPPVDVNIYLGGISHNSPSDQSPMTIISVEF